MGTTSGEPPTMHTIQSGSLFSQLSSNPRDGPTGDGSLTWDTQGNSASHNSSHEFGPYYNAELETTIKCKASFNFQKIYHNNNILCLDKNCHHDSVPVTKCKDTCKYCLNMQDTINLTHKPKYRFCCKRFAKVNCRTRNIIYLIKCECNLLYIGETSRTAMERWREHLREINTAVNCRNNQHAYNKKQILYDHFYRGSCLPQNLKFFILEICEQTDTIHRETREDFFIRLFNSAYPFGLNQKIKNFGNIQGNSNNLKLASHPYFNLQIVRYKRSHGCRRILGQRRRSMQKPDLLFINSYLAMNENDKRGINYSSLSLKTIKSLNVEVNKLDPFKIFLECKVHEIKNVHNFNADKNKHIFMVYEYSHRCFDRINISKIFNDTLKTNIDQQEIIPKINITYSYRPKISTLIHNQNRICRNITMEQITQAYNAANCCDHIPDKFKKDGHLATGNLQFCPNIINDALKYGNNFRYTQNLELHEVSDSLFKYFEKNANQLCKALKCNIELAKDLITEVNGKILCKYHEIIQQNAKTYNFSKTNHELASIIKSAKMLDKRFVISPVDKCTNNSSIICKNLYLQKLCDDLGISYNAVDERISIKGNCTFKPADMNEVNILEKHNKLNHKFLGKDLNNDNRKLATYYLIPKFHKKGNSLKTRPISNCRNSSFSDIADLLARALSHLREHFLNIVNLEKTYKGYIGITSVKSTDELIHELERLEGHTIIRSLHTYDFKSVFTSLEHKSIIYSIGHILNKCFNDRVGKYLAIGYNKCFYTNNINSSSKNVYLNIHELKELLETVLKESYVKVGNHIFNQVKGIPMGSKSSALLCDLSLIGFEHIYMHKPDSDKFRAFRYQDDILTINYDTLLLKCSQIYPDELELEGDSTENGLQVTYLDTRLTADLRHINRGLYDKRDDFNFEINNLFHNGSNVRASLINNVTYAQLIRICKICNNPAEFNNALLRLKGQIIKNNYNSNIIIKGLKKLAHNRFELLHKFLDKCQNRSATINKLIKKLNL